MLRHIIATLVIAASDGAAQAVDSCRAPEAHAFDFWIGEWTVEQRILRADGGWHHFEATTAVLPALDGCALIEHWRGTVQFFWEGMERPDSMVGLSVRAYDPSSNSWRIHWMDTRTPRFDTPYVGRFTGNRGEFFREWEGPQGTRVGRITFVNVAPDSVRWELAISSDGRASWSTLWTMDMHRQLTPRTTHPNIRPPTPSPRTPNRSSS